MKKIVGQITAEECQAIQALFNRRNALSDVSKVINASNDALYQRLIADIAENEKNFHEWWAATAEKYQWELTETGHWEIDFATYHIYLVD